MDVDDDETTDLSPHISPLQPQPDFKWSAQFALSARQSGFLSGDKLNLPPSALHALLAAAPTTVLEAPSARSYTSTFDPGNPYSYAAERAARAQFEERQQQLPQPLTFRLVNPENGRVIYAGIREFSAEEGEVELSHDLRQALDVKEGQERHLNGHERGDGGGEEHVVHLVPPSVPSITIHAAILPKGTFVKLRPLEAGYDPDDWKSLLEQHLRANFTTLTNGEILSVPHGKDEYRFLVDGFKPQGEAICIVDTDIEVEIEALNEEQARETLKRIADKARRAPGTESGSSVGGDLSIHGTTIEGRVVDGDYVDYQIPSWPRSEGLEIELSAEDAEAELDIYVSPYAGRHRVRPREEEHIWADQSSRPTKRIRLAPTNVELDNAESIYVSVHAYKADQVSDSSPRLWRYSIRASLYSPSQSMPLGDIPLNQNIDVPPNPGEVKCKNCLQWVPSASLILHENFCLRNNVVCGQGCGRVFQKRSDAFKNHWHCGLCPERANTYGDGALGKTKHNNLTHTSVVCPETSCSMRFDSTKVLAQHRVTECAGKLILCQFCHLQVPQGVADDPATAAECMLSNLTPHELADGARTTECHFCNKIVRLRDMRAHLLNHEMEKTSRLAPRVCRNVNCGRTLDGVSKTGDTRAATRKGNGPGNELSLCSTCFGPLYVSMDDPDGKALKRRVERRYFSQLVQGCGKSWCRNSFCKSGRGNAGVDPASVSTRDALPMIKPFLVGLYEGDVDGDGRRRSPLHFCVDEASQKRRGVAEMLAAEGVYTFEWCLAALEAEGGSIDSSRTWLGGWAPKKA